MFIIRVGGGKEIRHNYNSNPRKKNITIKIKFFSGEFFVRSTTEKKRPAVSIPQTELTSTERGGELNKQELVSIIGQGQTKINSSQAAQAGSPFITFVPPESVFLDEG